MLGNGEIVQSSIVRKGEKKNIATILLNLSLL